MIILPANTLAAGGFEVANSCLFDAGSDAYMHKTPGSSGNTGLKKFTFSTWVKRCGLATEQTLIRTKDGSNVECKIGFDASGELRLYAIGGSAILVTSAKYRDPSAWMHVVFAVDTTQGSASDRLKLYVNGTQVTAFGTATYPSADADMKMCGDTLHIIGGVWTDDRGGDLDAYLAETVLIDGTQYAASDFGEFDEDSPTIWKPKDVSGLTFGTNGFYLDYEDSSNLGNDANSGTDLTESGLAATDQATDTPTNNFSVLNPLMNKTAAYAFSEGNCKVVTTSGGTSGHYACSTIAPSKGKWYFEMKVASSSGYDDIGLVQDSADNFYSIISTNNGISYNSAQEVFRGSDGTGDVGGTFDTFTTNDIIGCYVDLDNHEFYVAKNGTIQNSGTGITIDTTSATDHGVWFLAVGDQVNAAAATLEVNFGGCSAFTVGSANSDANGYGNFEYDPSSGTFDGASKNFLALCTKNLAENG